MKCVACFHLELVPSASSIDRNVVFDVSKNYEAGSSLSVLSEDPLW